MKKITTILSLVLISSSTFAGGNALIKYEKSVCSTLLSQPYGYSKVAKRITLTELLGSNNVYDRVGNEITVDFTSGQTETSVQIFKNGKTARFKGLNLTFNYVANGGIPNSNIGNDIYDFHFQSQVNGEIKSQRMGCTK